jgi:chorismate-pyruvate lyase
MSAMEIIKELPQLTEQERRNIRQVLLDIANQDTDVAACNLAALQGAQLLDRLEDQDGQRKPR